MLEDEFITEGTYTVNVSPFDRIGAVLKDANAKGESSIDIMKWSYENAKKNQSQQEVLMERVGKDGFSLTDLQAVMMNQLPKKFAFDTILMQAALIKQV